MTEATQATDGDEDAPSTKHVETFRDLPGAFSGSCTSFYALHANDGLKFVSFGRQYPSVDGLEVPGAEYHSTTEWVETRVLKVFGDELDELPTEGEREDAPPRVGRLWWDELEEKVTAVSIDPDALDDD